MSTSQHGAIARICNEFGNDSTRLLDIALQVQREFGSVDSEAIDQVAEATTTSRVAAREYDGAGEYALPMTTSLL